MNIIICNVIGETACSESKKDNGSLSKKKLKEINERRLHALDALLEESAHKRADLVVLPGGYFGHNDASEPKNIIIWKDIWKIVKKRNIAVCFGIDTEEKHQEDVDLNNLFAFAWNAEEGRLPKPAGAWFQRSMRSTCAAEAKAKDDKSFIKKSQKVRKFHVGKWTIYPLMCGELFNRHIEKAIVEDKSKNKIVVDLVHTAGTTKTEDNKKGLGRFRANKALERWSYHKNIKAIVISRHAKTKHVTSRETDKVRYKCGLEHGIDGKFCNNPKERFIVNNHGIIIEAGCVKI